MSRPAGADWSPLADADPVPGEPYEVVRLSSSLRSIADGLKQQAETLRRLAGDQSWEGEAGPKFRATATDTANRLAKVYPRYQAAADALLSYQSELAAAQTTSLRALQEAKSADQARAVHERRLDDLDRAAQGDSPEHEAVSARLDDVGTQLAAARRLLESAVHRRHEAARAAASHMSSVMDHDGLQDGFFDKAGDWVRRNAEKIKGLADFLQQVGHVSRHCRPARLVDTRGRPGVGGGPRHGRADPLGRGPRVPRRADGRRCSRRLMGRHRTGRRRPGDLRHRSGSRGRRPCRCGRGARKRWGRRCDPAGGGRGGATWWNVERKGGGSPAAG